jgi:hypothetical protein
MANEHPNNRARGEQQQQQQGNQPEKKPPATPAVMAKAVADVSAVIEGLYPAEQIRVLKGVAMTNALDMFGSPKK